jgi:hypothetical protein
MHAHIATAGGGDYGPLSALITFSNGSTDGEEVCTSVIVNSDSEVEPEEHFNVMLAIVVSGTSFGLGNKTSVINLVDSDGK